MSENVVELRDVFCVHRTAQGDAAALQGVQLELGWGEVLCVLGPSGAGKSTLLRVIAGVQPPSAGTVMVLGCDIGRMGAAARARLRHQQLGFLDQSSETMLSPDLPVRAVVGLPLALRGVARRARARRVAELLEAAGLADRGAAMPGELSGGERQRAALCAALAHGPELLLADEPTGELDPDSAEALRALIVERAHRERTSVVVVSHDPASAAVADRVVRIRDGRVVAERRDGEEALIPGAVAGFAPAACPAAVELRAVTRGYGRRRVLNELTHTFLTGGLNVVNGPSGSGKTTLLRLLAGLDRPDAGAVTIGGERMSDLDAEARARLRRQHIGFLPQEPTPVGFLSALENVALALELRGFDTSVAGAALERVGLAERAEQRVEWLSAGEAQRVALARALACARGLLLVDEPSSRLDEVSARMVADVLAGAGGQTVICATHDPVLVARADAVVELSPPGRDARRNGPTDDGRRPAPI